jgi:uncharacterized protein YegP (UPF0339 family)
VKRPIKVEFVQSERTKQYRFRFVAGNGQILAVSESYKRLRKARASAWKIIKAAVDGTLVATGK